MSVAVIRYVSSLMVLTIGHSTRSIEEFVRLLTMHGVHRVVDVRTIPKSRHNPQFNRDRLRGTLHRTRIHYSHLAGLGGLRPAAGTGIPGNAPAHPQTPVSSVSRHSSRIQPSGSLNRKGRSGDPQTTDD
jgi:hypothetical protein